MISNPFFSLEKVYNMAKNNKKSSGVGKSLLYNRGVLYFIFILALGYLFFLSAIYDYYTLSIFVIIGFLTTFFSKNMIVILSLAMAVSFIFKFGTKIRAEGFEDESESSSSSSDAIKKLIGSKKSSSDSDSEDKKKSSSSSSDSEKDKKKDKDKDTKSSSNENMENKTANIEEILSKMKDKKSTD